MLEMKKNITLNGTSKIDGKDAEGYSVTIDSKDPSNMQMSAWQIDKEVYKENRQQCRSDRAAFEDAAYAIQDEMIQAKEG